VDRIIVRHLPLVVTKKLIPVELLHFIQNSPLHGLVPLLLTIRFLRYFVHPCKHSLAISVEEQVSTYPFTSWSPSFVLMNQVLLCQN
jgi:hypothetical protein